MTAKDRAVLALFDRLAESDFEGSQADLAAEIGTSLRVLRRALHEVRQAEFVSEYGWTVPFVCRGAHRNTWWLADVDRITDDARLKRSQMRRAEEMLKSTRRNIGQGELALEGVDKRSRAGRHWRHVLAHFRASEASLEQILEESENGT